MNVKWSISDTDPTRHYMRVGLLRAVVNEMPDGNLAYNVYVLIKGNKSIIHRVTDNPRGPKQVNAYIRCEHIVKCYDKYLGVALLDIEQPGVNGAVYQPKNIPKYRDGAIIAGIGIGRVYRHISSGAYYTIVSVANSTAQDNDKWPTTVVYRSLHSSETFCRSLETFTSERYELINPGEYPNFGLDFYRKINRIEGVNNEL